MKLGYLCIGRELSEQVFVIRVVRRLKTAYNEYEQNVDYTTEKR